MTPKRTALSKLLMVSVLLAAASVVAGGCPGWLPELLRRTAVAVGHLDHTV